MYQLMLRDHPVVTFDFNDFVLYIQDSDRLPISLRGKLTQVASNIPQKELIKETMKNIENLKEYFSSRILTLSRENAKQICAAFEISQNNSIQYRADVCVKCKGISITDEYWIKEENSKETWKDVNIRQNHFSEIVEIALCGESPNITVNPVNPELTSQGMFPKAWIRKDDNLYLLKSDKLKNHLNIKAEIMASKILDCTNIPHCEYKKYENKNIHASICKNFLKDGESFVEAREMQEFCKDTNTSYEQFLKDNFSAEFANMVVMDYYLQNTDRHDANYGFIMDSESGDIIGFAPNFDLNQALVSYFFEKDITDTLSQTLPGHQTLKEMYEKYIDDADICIDIERLKNVISKERTLNPMIQKIEEDIKKGRIRTGIEKDFQAKEIIYEQHSVKTENREIENIELER